jgi:hypothetical protein
VDPGVVAAMAVAQPNFAEWRPILQCDFDRSFSPLMELEYGRGRLILCTLGIEEHALRDPAAAQLTMQIVEYAQSVPCRPQGNGPAAGAIFAGDGVLFPKPAEPTQSDPPAPGVADKEQ